MFERGETVTYFGERATIDYVFELMTGEIYYVVTTRRGNKVFVSREELLKQNTYAPKKVKEYNFSKWCRGDYAKV